MADVQNYSLTKTGTTTITFSNYNITYKFTNVHNSAIQIGQPFSGTLSQFLLQFTQQQLDDATTAMVNSLLLLKASTL